MGYSAVQQKEKEMRNNWPNVMLIITLLFVGFSGGWISKEASLLRVLMSKQLITLEAHVKVEDL